MQQQNLTWRYNLNMGLTMKIKTYIVWQSIFHWAVANHLRVFFLITSKIPSISRTIMSAGTPAFAASGVKSVKIEVTAMPNPNT